MDPTGFFSAALALAIVLAGSPHARAQSAADAPPETPANAKPVPVRTVPTPFPPGAGPLEIARSIQLRSSDEMTEQDRLLEAGSESSIAGRAGFADIAFNEGKWSYRQLVCPALPNHLFLRFTRNNGAGDVSVFSASIPRNGEGRIRIIPIERRSYSLFSPAPVNALTIAAFNHIRAEDELGQPDPAPDRAAGWLGTALCYAALAGANPMAAPEDATGPRSFPSASAPSLEIPPQGGAIVRFTDFSAAPRPMEWTLIFSGKGRLLKATHGPAGIHGEKAIPPSTAEQNAKPVPSS
jgi:hypothetical protein